MYSWLQGVDVDLLECIHWRQGALLYMYCSTLSKQSERKTSQYAVCLTEGIKELTAMLNVRKKPATGETDLKDESTQQLLEKVML